MTDDSFQNNNKKTTDITNTTTCLTAVFANNNNIDIENLVETQTICYDDAEEERQIKSRVGYRTKFPMDVLQK